MFGFPRRAATGNTMCRSSAGWRPSKSSEARTFLGLATSDSPTFAGVVLPTSAGITIGGFLRLTGSASYTNVRGPDGATRIWLSAAQSFHDSDTHNFRLSVGTGWGAVACGAATIYGSPPGTAGAGEVRIGGGNINAAGEGAFVGLTVAGLSMVTGEAGLGSTGYPGSVGFAGATTTHYTGDGTGWTWRLGYRTGGITTALLSIDDSARYVSVLGSVPGTAGAGEVRIGGGRLDAADSITSGGTLSSITTDSAAATQVDGLVVGHRSTGTPAAGFGSNLRWVAESTTTNDRTQGLIEARWVTATDASRTARLSAYVADSAATREAWRVEADGSAARIGFLGASAVARQSVGSAATDAATTQTLANNIRSALISLGLCQT